MNLNHQMDGKCSPVLRPPVRHKDIAFKQTMAAVGQVRLMGLYEQFFGLYQLPLLNQ